MQSDELEFPVGTAAQTDSDGLETALEELQTDWQIPFQQVDLAESEEDLLLLFWLALAFAPFLLPEIQGPKPHDLRLQQKIQISPRSLLNTQGTVNKNSNCRFLLDLNPPGYQLNKQPQQLPVPMMMRQGFPRNIEDLTLIELIVLDKANCLDEGGQVVGLELQGTDEVVEGKREVVVLEADDSEEVEDGVGTEMISDVDLADVLGLLDPVGLHVE